MSENKAFSNNFSNESKKTVAYEKILLYNKHLLKLLNPYGKMKGRMQL